MANIDVLSELEDLGDGEKPWADFAFDLASIKLKKAVFGSGIASIQFDMIAKHEGDTVGLRVALKQANWKVGPDKEIPVSWGEMHLSSLGLPSDRLLRLYESWWEMPTSTVSMTPTLAVVGVCLSGSPKQASLGKVDFKLFFDANRKWEGDGADPVYGELYLSFDLDSRRGWLNEKDPDYRGPVLGWLTGQITPNKQ